VPREAWAFNTKIVRISRTKLFLPYSPPIRFLGSSLLGELSLSDLDPAATIPLGRPGSETVSGYPLVTYFQTIQEVIEKDSYENLLTALRTRLNRPVTLAEVKEIRIFSEKHGSDYHPAKVEVSLPDQVIPFAANVALTERGLFILSNEFNILSNLNHKYGLRYLPKTYFLEEVEPNSSAGVSFPSQAYLADWLEGYYEFHLSIDPADDRQKIVLWDNPRHNHYLPEALITPIYKEIARILTVYYDLETFAQIHPWHLAAGDFIARLENNRVAVRLVAARQYGPLIGPEDLPWEEALLFFMLNLTLRVRLDRLDGVGEIAWAEEGCLRSALDGFSLALLEKAEEIEFKEDYPRRFRRFVKSRSKKDLEERLDAIIRAYDPSAPDLSIIEKHLNSHLEAVIGQEIFQ
jgi:hypothetical protein